jgi:hypothetical protein
MSDPTLQDRFAAALRRELGMADGAQPGAAVVHVAPAQVTVSPRVVAELPALTEPVLVEDVRRFGGAFTYELRPERDASGALTRARMVPIEFVPFGDAHD